MRSFRALVWLYLRDLRRRRFVWVLALLVVAGVALQYWTARTVEDAVGEGMSYSMATKRAASNLEGLAAAIRGWGTIFVVLLAAQLAPESRRNGTTQFVLSAGVRRDTLAAVQFVALAMLIAAASLVVHIGFSIPAVNAGAMTFRDAALSWTTLTGPWLALAAAVFAFSLTASTVESYLVFLGAPLVTAMPAILGHMPRRTPAFVIHVLDNLGLLFPNVMDLILWPHASAQGDGSTPAPTFAGPLAHTLCALSFWVLLGLWLHREHDFGSRTAVR